MGLYELTIIFRPDVSKEGIEKSMLEFKEMVEKGGGKFLFSEYWGFRTLAYPIEKRRKAHYVLVNMEVGADHLAEIAYWLKFHRDVMRFLNLRVEEALKGPTLLYQTPLFGGGAVEESDAPSPSGGERRYDRDRDREADGIAERKPDYKDLRLLQRSLTESGKIIPARVMKYTRKRQAQVALAIKRARYLALLAYVLN